MEQTLGPYELIARLGAGGMGVVYRARDSRDGAAAGAPAGRFVALKVLHDHRSGERDYVRRFEEEARLATRLHHPNIVTVYEAGEVDGQHYLAMELVEGETLADRLVRRRRLRPDEVRQIAIAVASALEEAHRQKVAHRDIKPGNVLMGHDGSIKVSDFGIARALDATSQTMTGTFLGSVAYASPEAIDGKTDPRGDLYSLGILLYQALLGHVPFEGNNAAAVMRMHEREAPPDLDRLRAADPALGPVIERLLQKDPDDRYQSASHLLRAMNAGGRRGGGWGAALRWATAGLGGLALVGGGAALALFLTGFFEGDTDETEPTPTAALSPTATPDPRNSTTPSPNAATATVVSIRQTIEAGIWIEGVATAEAQATETAIAGTPTPPRTPTPIRSPVPSRLMVTDVSPALGTTVSSGDDIEITVDYVFPSSGRVLTLVAYFRLPLSSGPPTTVFSSTTLGNSAGTVELSATSNRSGVVFCGYVVDAGSAMQARGGECAPE